MHGGVFVVQAVLVADDPLGDNLLSPVKLQRLLARFFGGHCSGCGHVEDALADPPLEGASVPYPLARDLLDQAVDAAMALGGELAEGKIEMIGQADFLCHAVLSTPYKQTSSRPLSSTMIPFFSSVVNPHLLRGSRRASRLLGRQSGTADRGGRSSMAIPGRHRTKSDNGQRDARAEYQ